MWHEFGACDNSASALVACLCWMLPVAGGTLKAFAGDQRFECFVFRHSPGLGNSQTQVITLTNNSW